MKTWFARIGMEELKCPAQIPDFNPAEHLWSTNCAPGPPHLTSKSDLTNTPVAEGTQIPPATLQNLVKSGYYNIKG